MMLLYAKGFQCNGGMKNATERRPRGPLVRAARKYGMVNNGQGNRGLSESPYMFMTEAPFVYQYDISNTWF